MMLVFPKVTRRFRGMMATVGLAEPVSPKTSAACAFKWKNQMFRIVSLMQSSTEMTTLIAWKKIGHTTLEGQWWMNELHHAFYYTVIGFIQ